MFATTKIASPVFPSFPICILLLALSNALSNLSSVIVPPFTGDVSSVEYMTKKNIEYLTAPQI